MSEEKTTFVDKMIGGDSSESSSYEYVDDSASNPSEVTVESIKVPNESSVSSEKAPTPKKKIPIKSNRNIEVFLKERGYTVERKIVIKRDEGYEAKFFKVWSPLSEPFYLNLDLDGNVKLSKSDPIFDVNKKTVELPYDSSMSSFNVCKRKCNGVMFEYVSDLIALVSDYANMPEKTVYSHISGDFTSIPISYPLISLKSLYNKEEYTRTSISECTTKLRNINITVCTDILDRSKKLVMSLGNSYMGVHEDLEKAFRDTTKSIYLLREDIKEEKEEHDYNKEVKKREELLENLFLTCHTLHSIVTELQVTMDKLNNMNDTITKTYHCIADVYLY